MNVERQRIIEAFERVPRPDLSRIRPLGCCDEHEPDFAWYRQHSWREFEKELPSGRFDPFEFFALHPLAYHYFTPGVLLATFESIAGNPKLFNWYEDGWIGNLTPRKKSTVDFKGNYLPLFDSQQRNAVASHLRTFNDWYINSRGYGDADIERAIVDIWEDETQHAAEPERR